jgi:NAD(P)-dependent dehydrogenase (short-subunit alcohol dehydrogenase family)
MYPPAIHPTAAPAKGRGPSCRGHGPLTIGKCCHYLKDSVQRRNGSRLAPGKRGENFTDCIFNPDSFAHSQHEARAAGDAGSAQRQHRQCFVDLRSRRYPNASVYAASKHVVEGLSTSAALEVAGSGVRVNAVAPGPTETGMLNRFTGNAERKAGLVSTVPLGRVGQPDEIADAILFLCSDKASFISGHVLSVDGGKSAG